MSVERKKRGHPSGPGRKVLYVQGKKLRPPQTKAFGREGLLGGPFTESFNKEKDYGHRKGRSRPIKGGKILRKKGRKPYPTVLRGKSYTLISWREEDTGRRREMIIISNEDEICHWHEGEKHKNLFLFPTGS